MIDEPVRACARRTGFPESGNTFAVDIFPAMTEDIRFYDHSTGRWCILSNLYEERLSLDGIEYATPEHAFQVLRARDPAMKAWIAAAPTPTMAAVVGDALKVEETSEGWETRQLLAMERILEAKFAEPRFRDLLLSTGDAYLVEWSPVDYEVGKFWGEYKGQGQNHLGRMLMALRTRLSAA